MTSPHPFDQAIALAPNAEGEYTGATSPAYANMVGPFGGVTAAVALTVNFCAALADGVLTATARPARTNWGKLGSDSN
jgi:acyl-coenzyme A thioesterase PaaI-like protein